MNTQRLLNQWALEMSMLSFSSTYQIFLCLFVNWLVSSILARNETEWELGMG